MFSECKWTDGVCSRCMLKETNSIKNILKNPYNLHGVYSSKLMV